MSPAPRRGRAAPAAPAAEAQPRTRRRGRQAAPEPTPATTDGAEETTTVARAKYTPEERLNLGEQIAGMREDNTPWLEIAEELGLSGGVPARQMMNEYLASTDPDFALDPDANDFADTVVELRDAGTGWGELQARSGLSKSELIEVYTEAGGEYADGRVYHNAKTGSTTHKLGSTRTSDNGDTDEQEDAEQEAPTPRRGRGRARSAPTEEQPAAPARRGRRRQSAT